MEMKGKPMEKVISEFLDKVLTSLAKECFEEYSTERIPYKQIRIIFCSRFIANYHLIVSIILKKSPDKAVDLLQYTNN